MTTAVVSWQDKLAALAKQSVAQEAHSGGGQFIGTRAGQLSYQGSPVAGNKLDVIVIDAIMENAYYEGDFDPDQPAPPVCFAFGRSDDEMAPHPDSAKPQSEKCKGCPQNEFGTAERGGGKACKNIRRLALIPAKPLEPDAVRVAEVAYLKTPVTSVKNWATYVKTLDALQKKPPLAVVTQISSQPDPKSQFKLTFNHQINLPDEILEPVIERYESISEEIKFPYAPQSSEAKKPEPKGRGRKY